MGYTKFCDGYTDFTIGNKLTNHLLHKPGVRLGDGVHADEIMDRIIHNAV